MGYYDKQIYNKSMSLASFDILVVIFCKTDNGSNGCNGQTDLKDRFGCNGRNVCNDQDKCEALAITASVTDWTCQNCVET